MYVYILTNLTRTVLYIGMTNDLSRRLNHHQRGRGTEGKFTSLYQADRLVYFEVCPDALQAIVRKKQLQGWTRAKKEALITAFNRAWETINPYTWRGGRKA
ncbi:GIY-YIG nuclease family protein [Hymenobacter weizhouensis]|uniref:GIY-YIG nuclease family protein n=1 Tax=Hymenobacter sp. YIM 151500-1 TaxID=2987689 RepID=UPI00222788CF|nr:GIY-YIG nuclease family protein [Hymenobacter sp. YIM 151500-1]UYZ63513.1 GIY-YIG nuclease family protein [Hymenobacter sp. YIM 151500-1]